MAGLLGGVRGLNDACFLNGVFQVKPFRGEADISRHSWFVPMGPWWKDPRVVLNVKITVGIVQETFSYSCLAAGRAGT